jgi:hypothetical protein
VRLQRDIAQRRDGIDHDRTPHQDPRADGAGVLPKDPPPIVRPAPTSTPGAASSKNRAPSAASQARRCSIFTSPARSSLFMRRATRGGGRSAHHERLVGASIVRSGDLSRFPSILREPPGRPRVTVRKYWWGTSGFLLALQWTWTRSSCASGSAFLWPRASSHQAHRSQTRSVLPTSPALRGSSSEEYGGAHV